MEWKKDGEAEFVFSTRGAIALRKLKPGETFSSHRDDDEDEEEEEEEEEEDDQDNSEEEDEKTREREKQFMEVGLFV